MTSLQDDSSQTAPQTNSDHAFVEPISDRIEMEDSPRSGFTVSFSPAASWSYTGIPAFLFMMVLLVGLRLLFDPMVGTPSFAIATLLGAGGLLYWIWTRWLHTATITVANGVVTITNTPFLMSGRTTTIPYEALDDATVSESLHVNNATPYFALDLHVQNPSQVNGSCSGQDTIWVADGLPYEGELEWIADRICKVAKQSASPT